MILGAWKESSRSSQEVRLTEKIADATKYVVFQKKLL